MYIMKLCTIISTFKLLVTWEEIKLWSKREYFYAKYQSLQASFHIPISAKAGLQSMRPEEL